MRDSLLTPRQVADRLQVSIGWVLDHASGRRLPVLPSLKLGKSVRFREAELDAFLEKCRRCIAAGVAIH